MPSDASSVLVAGPWEHRYVSANGARFHVASAGDGPLVLFLHTFPQFWWTWRHQLEGLAAAGNTVVIVEHDMRMVAACDWVIDLGPGAGSAGGQVVACGTPAELAHQAGSRTAPYLAKALQEASESRAR